MDSNTKQPGRNEASEPTRALVGAGILTSCVYLATGLFYWDGFQRHSRTARELFSWIAVIPLLYLFWRGYRVVRDGDAVQTRTVVVFAAVFCTLCIFVYPFHSTDVFGYINRGWEQVHYHLNPYVSRVADMPGWRGDPMIWNHWIYNPNPYGFLFSLLARALTFLGNGNWHLTLLLFKAVNAIAFGLTGWLIWSGARYLGQTRPLLALYSLVWNPLILIHHIANGHNDILVGCLVALALSFMVRGREPWVLPVLAAATMLKHVPAFLLPPALFYIYRRRGWKTAATGCVLALLVVIAVSAPYLTDWQHFKLGEIRDNATLTDNSLHPFLIQGFENITWLVHPLARFHEAIDTGIRFALLTVGAIFVLIVYAKSSRNTSPEGSIELMTLLLLALMCVVTSKFNAWYMGMILPAALFLPAEHWLRRLTLLVTCAQTLSLTFLKQAHVLNYLTMIIVPVFIVWRQIRRERKIGDLPAAAEVRAA